jgi:hypothetical protein
MEEITRLNVGAIISAEIAEINDALLKPAPPATGARHGEEATPNECLTPWLRARRQRNWFAMKVPAWSAAGRSRSEA